MSLNSQISNNLKETGIETRLAKSQGLWCYMLLPFILTINTIIYKTSTLYQIITFVSVGLFFYGSLFIIFLSISSVIIKEPVYGGCMASSLISTILIYIFSEKDLLSSLICSLPCIYFFNALIKVALINFPKTFTIGEAMVVVQSLTLFVTASTLKFVHDLLNDTNEEYTFINTIIFIGLSTLGLIVTALFYLDDKHRNLWSLQCIVAAGITAILIILHCIMGPTCLIRIYDYIFMDIVRVKLLIFWLALVILSVLVLYVSTRLAVKATTVKRKTFHLLASLVFLSGVLTDVPFMTLAAGVGLALIIFVEALRIARIEPISSALQSTFVIYGDEKDCGAFAMTPLYLYAGLACPLLLAPATAPLELLSGVLAVGVGDTVASCAGATIGRTRWADSNRTLEGTAFNILSQVAVVYALEFFELLQARHALARTVIAATASALTEAKTDQVDNLVLPLVTILAFQATRFLS
ncbi:unnamed protein product, partial [Iphiclides podalirius]